MDATHCGTLYDQPYVFARSSQHDYGAGIVWIFRILMKTVIPSQILITTPRKMLVSIVVKVLKANMHSPVWFYSVCFIGPALLYWSDFCYAGEDLLRFAYGQTFSAEASLLSWLGILPALSAPTEVQSVLLLASERVRALLLIQGASLAIGGTVAVIMVLRLGLIGMIYGMILKAFVESVCTTYWSRTSWAISPYIEYARN